MQAVTTTRRFDRALAAAIVASVCAWLTFAMPVSADPPGGDPAGNNGTVKVHDGDGEAEPIRRNEPHVNCSFHIHAFGLDANQRGDWEVLSWPPTGDRSRAYIDSDGYSADASGEYVSEVITLPPGHYKLFFEGRDASPPNGEIDAQNIKHKVFWIECDAASGQAGSGTAGAGDTTGGTTGGAVLGGHGVGPRGGVAGGGGGPGAGSLPDTAVPAELAGSLGGLLVILSGIAYTANRRRDS